jgi:hypothetical protein
VAVIVQRRGDVYAARVGAPELARDWETDRPYGRNELRRIIEDLGDSTGREVAAPVEK